MAILAKKHQKRVQTFAGGTVWVDVREKLLMGRLTVLPNDEDMLLTDLSSKVRKKFRPKKRFSQIWFLGRKIFLCKKSHQYPNSNSPLFGPIVEKRFGSFSRRYCQFGVRQKVGFFDLGPKNRLIPSGAIWANVREKLLMGRLTVLPNDEDLLLTDLSSKVRKKF